MLYCIFVSFRDENKNKIKKLKKKFLHKKFLGIMFEKLPWRCPYHLNGTKEYI